MDAVWGWVFGLVIWGGLIVWVFVLSDSSKNAIWYGATYRVSTDKVHTFGNKPHDCDWVRAPIGDKGCHYEADVRAYDAAGEIVGGNDVPPRYGKDGKPVKPSRLEVWWRKVKED
jgi:hypothetical protein